MARDSRHGYGRYDSDPEHVGCPWSGGRSEIPCVARDGQLALSGGPKPQCAGCGNYLPFLIRDLADDYEPATEAAKDIPPDAAEAADLFRHLVLQATEPLTGGESDDRPGPAEPADPPA
jgi:hypothetical protein